MHREKPTYLMLFNTVMLFYIVSLLAVCQPNKILTWPAHSKSSSYAPEEVSVVFTAGGSHPFPFTPCCLLAAQHSVTPHTQRDNSVLVHLITELLKKKIVSLY